MSEGISLEELQLAARNHALPLEALRWDVTPIGLHYLLTHFDIPKVDVASWRLEVGGLVERPVSLSLEELRARPAVEVAVTMECAGNGRVHIEPHVVSQPWLLEAVGTARWRGVTVASVLEEAGVRDGAVEALFTGLDRGIDGGEEQAYERSLPVEMLLEGDALLAYEINGEPLPPQHGAPLRLVVPGWYGMTSVKWLSRITLRDEPFDGYQMRQAYRVRLEEDEPGEAITTIAPRSLMVPPGIPEFRSRERLVQPGPCEIVGRAWSGAGRARRGRRLDGRRRHLGAGRARRRGSRPLGLALVALRVGRRARRARALLSHARHSRERAAAGAGLESGRLPEQRGAARQRHGLVPADEPALRRPGTRRGAGLEPEPTRVGP